MAKYFQVKVYNQNNDYLTTWTDIVSNIMFSNEINSAGGQMTFKLARNAGDYGEGSDIDFGHKVKVYVFDKELPNGNLIFQGFISAYTPIYKDDSVDIMLLSYGAELADYIIEGGEALKASQTSETNSGIFGNDISPSNIHYIAQTITVDTAYKISRMQVVLATIDRYDQSTGLFSERFNLECYADIYTGNNPPEAGTFLGTSSPFFIPDGTWRDVSILFNPTISLAAGVYSIVIRPSTFAIGSDHHNAAIKLGNGYSGGAYWQLRNDWF